MCPTQHGHNRNTYQDAGSLSHSLNLYWVKTGVIITCKSHAKAERKIFCQSQSAVPGVLKTTKLAFPFLNVKCEILPCVALEYFGFSRASAGGQSDCGIQSPGVGLPMQICQLVTSRLLVACPCMKTVHITAWIYCVTRSTAPSRPQPFIYSHSHTVWTV